MWKEYFKFEVTYRRNQPLFWIAGLVLFLMGLLLVSTDLGLMLGNGNTALNRNAPSIIINSQIFLSTLGMFVLIAFVADSVLRDFSRNTHMFFFSKPAGKGQYLAGRFLGSTFMTIVLFLAPLAGFMVAHFVPWQDSGRMGPLAFGPMFYGFFLFLVPNMLALGAFFFTAAVLSRRLLVVYIMAIVVVFMQDGIEIAADSLNNLFLGSIIEPLGVIAMKEMTRYYSVVEYNTLLPVISLGTVVNRLVWLGFGAIWLVIGFKRFQTSAPSANVKNKKVSKNKTSAPAVHLPVVGLNHGFSGSLYRLFFRIRLEMGIVFKSTPFLVLLFTGGLFTLLGAYLIGMYRGTPTIPITDLMLDVIKHVVKITLPVIIMIYTGELIWRDQKTAAIEDVMPVPDWVYMSSKILTVFAVVGVIIGSSVLTAVAYQLLNGYSTLEPMLYLKGIGVIGFPMLLIASAAFFLHTLASSKNQGHLLVLLFLCARFAFPRVGLENLLFRFGDLPPMIHSVFNGYGHFTAPFLLYVLYWGLGAAILLLFTSMLWRRGPKPGLRRGLELARLRFRGANLLFFVLLLAGFLGSGMVINERFQNNRTLSERDQQLASYEVLYGQYKDLPKPRIVGVNLALDLYPNERRAHVKGSYDLVNKSGSTIVELPVTMSPRFIEGFSLVEGAVTLVSMGGLTATVSDETLGFYLFTLKEPLLPDGEMNLEFEVKVDQSAYRSRVVNHQIVGNGSHLVDRSFLPFPGYQLDNELRLPNKRRRKGLEPQAAYPTIDNVGALDENYMMADWVDYEAVVSTIPDQVVVAQGDLQREWLANGRRFFHYKSRAPITNLLGFVSGEYEVKRERHGEVDIEIYHHPKHHQNIDQMMKVARTTLDYSIKAFGPYPHGQLRIVEIPKYDKNLAISYAGGLIAITEDSGLTCREGGINIISYYVSHEVAHQWWNHQVVSAGVQGACMIGESLSQYTSLAVLEELYGKPAVINFLLEDEKTYFQGRQREALSDMPLFQVENQAYIHYSKANVVFHALRDVMGEAGLNQTLRDFMTDYRFKGWPYPTAAELVDRFRDALPEEHHYLIHDLFETITLYDNRVVSAHYQPLSDGKFKVDLTLSTVKLRIDENGEEVVAESGGFVEIACYEKGSDEPFIIESQPITGSQMQVSFVVDREPGRVGLDPLLKMMDRDRKDNFIEIQNREAR